MFHLALFFSSFKPFSFYTFLDFVSIKEEIENRDAEDYDNEDGNPTPRNGAKTKQCRRRERISGGRNRI